MRGFEELESLHERCRAGDINAKNEMAEIVRKYGYNLGLKYFGLKKDMANDFAQELYLAYDRYRDTIKDIRVWLVGVPGKLATTFIRNEYRWNRGADLAENWYPQPDSLEQQIVDRLHIQSEMQNVNQRARAVIHLRIWQDLPFSNIAQTLNVTTDNAKRIYQRALKKLAVPLQLFSPPA